jgi:hypothetical protein
VPSQQKSTAGSLSEQEAIALLRRVERGEGIRGEGPNGVQMYAFRGYPPFDYQTRFWHVTRGKQMDDAAPTYDDPAQVIEYMRREGGVSRFWPSDDFKPQLSTYTPRKAVGPAVMDREQAIQILTNAEPWTGVKGTGPNNFLMIAVKVNPEVSDYDAKRPFEIRTEGEHGNWTNVRHYRDAAQAIAVLIKEARISQFQPYAE